MNNGFIITMASITVGSAVTQKIFSAVGKSDEAQYLDLTTKCFLGITALATFATFIKTLASIG